MLVAFAVGSLWKSEGGKLVTEGDGFANNLTQYDDFKSGPLFDTDDLEPFGFTLDSFDGDVRADRARSRAPRAPSARHITTSSAPTASSTSSAIEVNTPLDIAGNKVYLLSHGYSPVVTVKDGRGKVVYNGAVPFLPQDAKNLTSTGVVKVPGAQTKDGKRDQLGFQGFFVPTFGGTRHRLDVLAVPRAGLPGAVADRLPRRPGHGLRPAAERLPARHQRQEEPMQAVSRDAAQTGARRLKQAADAAPATDP